MTHGGQEFALGAIRGFGGRFGALQIFLRPLAYDHLPELRANVPHHGQQLLIGLRRLKRKELQNSDDLLFHQDRESESRAESGLLGRTGSLRQGLFAGQIDDPLRLAGSQNTTGQACSGGGMKAATRLAEVGEPGVVLVCQNPAEISSADAFCARR